MKSALSSPSLVVCGINHTTAPIEIREKVSFSPSDIPAPLFDLINKQSAQEAAILSTCNRTELYCATHDASHLAHWLETWHELEHTTLSPHLYFHHDEAAIRHMMRVASGLDSLILGEPQILGQIKTAYTIANQAGTLGTQLQRLFQHVFAVTKQIRTHTEIGMHPVSIAYAAVNLAKRIFSSFSDTTVLLIGAGQTIELAAQHLHEQGVGNLIIANRTLAQAQRLARKFNGEAMLLSDAIKQLPQADIIVTATGSTRPLLGKGCIETTLKARKHKPMLMIDIAVPRNIEPEVAELPDVYLYTVDDLEGLIEENTKSRQDAAKQAEHIIELQAAHFIRSLRSLDSVPTICAYRDKIESIRNEELAKSLRALQQGKPSSEVLTALARNLSNKLMHGPSAKMRQAAYDGQFDILEIARDLFELKS